MGNIVADTRKRVDHGFHLIEHSVDDGRQSREGLVCTAMRKPLAKVACDNASNSLIDLLDPLFGANTQPRPRYHAEDEQGQKAERERFTNHLRELPGFIDVSSDHKHRAIRQPPADGPNQRVARLPLIDPRNPHALYRLVDLELTRYAREVAGNPFPICVK